MFNVQRELRVSGGDTRVGVNLRETMSAGWMCAVVRQGSRSELGEARAVGGAVRTVMARTHKTRKIPANNALAMIANSRERHSKSRL